MQSISIGQELGSFSRKRTDRAWVMVLVGLALLGGAIGAITQSDPAVRYGVSAVLFLVSVATIYFSWFRGKLQVSVFENGFRIANDTKDVSAAWNEVKSLRFQITKATLLGIPYATGFWFLIELVDGQKLQVHSMQKQYQPLYESFIEKASNVVTRASCSERV